MEDRPRKGKEGQPTRSCGGDASALAQRPGSPGKARMGGSKRQTGKEILSLGKSREWERRRG